MKVMTAKKKNIGQEKQQALTECQAFLTAGSSSYLITLLQILQMIYYYLKSTSYTAKFVLLAS